MTDRQIDRQTVDTQTDMLRIKCAVIYKHRHMRIFTVRAYRIQNQVLISESKRSKTEIQSSVFDKLYLHLNCVLMLN